MGGPGSFLIGNKEKEEVLEVLESGYLFRYGSEDDSRFKHKVVQFEDELCSYLGTNHCVATSSGTGALMAILYALGIGPGDEVIVPAYTFIASISSVILMGATPVLAEIDESLTLDPEDVRRRISSRTRAIMAVHMLGNPCDMKALKDLAGEHGLYIIEDACQALGASYGGKKCGTLGEMGAFSLNFFKTITAGDGGAVVTDSGELYERAFGFHDQGHKPKRMGVEVGHRNIVGMNMRMNELTGAVALAQCRKIESILAQLRKSKALLKSHLEGVRGVAFRRINDLEECATVLTLLFDSKERADQVAESIGSSTVVHSGWHVYSNMEQILHHLRIQPGAFPQTDRILERSLNISVGVVDVGLGTAFGINVQSEEPEIEEVGRKLRDVLSGKPVRN